MYLGIEIGGTKLQLGLGDGDGTLHALVRATVLGNDADVAGLAEALFGAGKGLSPIFYITIGSGIGGGLIINGEIYRGVGRGAAEIGHLRFMSPSIIGEWRSYALEEVASGW